MPIELELCFGTNRLSNPVALHLLGGLGPVEIVQSIEQAFGVLGDLENPLTQVALDDRAPAALAAAINDFLVGESRLAGVTPVDGHLGLVGQPLIEELQEDPLRPLVVLGICCVDLTIPVVGEAELLDLAAESVDVAISRLGRVRPRLDGVVLGRQTERVPAHGMQHVHAAHALVAAEDVGGRVTFRMPDVEPLARRIGKHVENVVLGLGRVLGDLEGLVLFPVLLPAWLDVSGFVGHG